MKTTMTTRFYRSILILVGVSWVPSPAALAACAPQPPGMTGWWSGNGVTTDSINGRDAVMNNGATYATGLVGQAFSFDGGDDDASVAHASALNVGTGDFTVDFWARPDVDAGEQVMVEKWDESGPGTGWTIADRGGLYFAGSGNAIQTSDQLGAGGWSHVALRRAGGTVSLFLNGAEVGTATDSTNYDNSVPLLFGRRRGGQGFFWQGRIDEIHYFVGTALSNGEIQAIHGAGGDGVCGGNLCGNGDLDAGEPCDDGNITDGDGCDSDCTVTACGNGIVTAGEACDDGNATETDACRNDCTFNVCGDSFLNAGVEECDDGGLVDGDGCDSNCTITACGNGLVTPPENCDDENATDGDGCDNNCTVTECGNGVTTSGEACDDGNATEDDACRNDCTANVCGDGATYTGVEECDDGNVFEGDGCESDCTITGPCAPVPVDLTAWWTGDGGSADIRGGFNAIPRNGATFGVGRVRQAFELDGINDFIEVADDPGIDVGSGDFTVDLWVRFDDTAEEQVLIEKYVEAFNETSSGWTLTKLSNDVVQLATATESANSSRQDLLANTWYHFAVRRDSGAVSVFLDGEEIASADIAEELTSPSSLKFGHRGSPFNTPGSLDTRGFHLRGRIDEVHFVKGRGLSDLEVQAIHAAGSSGFCVAPAVCGNAIIEAGEPCDDGNGVDGDGCDVGCLLSCGNGAVDPGEECDDGNPTDDDGCDGNCTITACGNGVIAGGETCEDGNVANGDGCDSNCTETGCGNAVATQGESCDDGNAAVGDGCENDCTLTSISEVVPPGGSVNTDPVGSGATPQAPFQTSLTTPEGGTVTIESADENLTPAGVEALVRQLLIEAPPATPENPLIIVLRVDASAIPPGLDLLRIDIVRNGVLLEPCSGPVGHASPNPCLDSRLLLPDGDVEITALTSHGSVWGVVASGLSEGEQDCVESTSRAGLGVLAAQIKLNASCLKGAATGTDPDAEACLVTDARGKVGKEMQKTIDVATTRCSTSPPFGFVSASAVNTASRTAALDLMSDLFGPGLDGVIATDAGGAACQSAAVKAVGKLALLDVDVFLDCEMAGLAGDPSTFVSKEQIDACFDSFFANAKRLKAIGKLGKTIAKKCADASASLPGACGTAVNKSYCLPTRVACRTCQMMNTIADLERDCDLLDDFFANGSCS